MKQTREELQALESWVVTDLGDEGRALIPLCVARDSSRPLYLSHVPIAAAAARLEGFPAQAFEDLQAGYVYLTATYYCMDAVVDGHKHVGEFAGANRFDLPAASVLLATSMNRLLRAFEAVRPAGIMWLGREFRDTIAANARALRAESYFCADPQRPFSKEAEFFHMWARSNTFLFLFELASALAGEPFPDFVRRIICSTLYSLQFGDDIGDWREDYRAKKWTPFLRVCFGRTRGFPTEEQLEEAIYLRGELEDQMSGVIRDLRDLARELPSDERYTLLREFIEWQSLKAERALTDFVEEKLASGVRYVYEE